MVCRDRGHWDHCRWELQREHGVGGMQRVEEKVHQTDVPVSPGTCLTCKKLGPLKAPKGMALSLKE